jgi:hypothetical protein
MLLAIQVEPAVKAQGELCAPLPPWYPAWARQMAEFYFTGTTSMFVLWGNVHDPVCCGAGADDEFCSVAEFLASQLFGRWDLVIDYDLGRGQRPQATRSI